MEAYTSFQKDAENKPLPYLLSSGLGSLAAGLQQRKDHQCDVALKLLPGSLKLQGDINARSPV